MQVPVHGDHGRLSSLSIGGDPFVLRARSREPIGWYRGLDHAAASRRRKLSLRFAGTHGRGWDSPRKPITHTRYTRRLAPPPSSTRLPPNLVNGGPPPLFFSFFLSLSPRWWKDAASKGSTRRILFDSYLIVYERSLSRLYEISLEFEFVSKKRSLFVLREIRFNPWTEREREDSKL